MADKPKTYPQQIQELKQQLADKSEQLIEAQEKVSSIDALQEENVRLKDQLQAQLSTDVQGMRADKAKQTDLEQRAVSAEAALKVAQQKNVALQAELAQQQTALSHRDQLFASIASKDAKIDTLAGELSAVGVQLAQVQQNARDQIAEAQRQADAISAELKQLRMAARGHENEITAIRANANEQVARLAAQKDDLVAQILSLRERERINEEVISQFRSIIDDVPDTKGQLSALLNRVQIAESTVT